MTVGAIGAFADNELPGLEVLAHEMATAAFTFFELAGNQRSGKMSVEQPRRFGCNITRQAGASLGPLLRAGCKAGGSAPGIDGNMTQR